MTNSTIYVCPDCFKEIAIIGKQRDHLCKKYAFIRCPFCSKAIAAESGKSVIIDIEELG